MNALLYHISEEGDIERFDPRPPPSIVNGQTSPCVWAINERHRVNYLLPRDCPRVTFYPLPDSSLVDIEQFMGPNAPFHVIVIETGWKERAMNTPLWIYAFDPDEFRALDEGAGYFISEMSVTPISKQCIQSPLKTLARLGVELRTTDNLWPLRDAIIESTLQFSCIRMRNARPKEEVIL